MTTRRIEIYDTTLRDGSQGQGISFSLLDKLKITQHLDALGVDYIEGGFPMSNPKDAAYFAQVRDLPLKHARVCAFGMTRRKGVKAQDDPGMQALVEAQAPVITIVGKTWDLHVDEVLHVSRQENLAMIGDSLCFCRDSGRQVFYDAEHFFDGYRGNAEYALATLRAALEGGAERLVLCDTNGGSLPGWVTQAVAEVRQALGPQVQIGIHTHNDGGLAVANTLAAVDAGAVQVQGTINGIGERCGNVDLTTVIANLKLKMDLDCLTDGSLERLTETSRFVYEMANLNLWSGQPFVGNAAFAHKGGMHVHAVNQLARSYEHVEPEKVGNARRILVSELAGVSNVAATVGRKFDIAGNKDLQRKLVAKVAELENQGYQFEAAEASFELLLREMLGTRPAYWKLSHYRCVIVKMDGRAATTEASVKLAVGQATAHEVAEGDGPVNALDGALRKCLRPHYPQISRLHLRDYKVRVVNATAESAAKVRVVAEFAVADGQGPQEAAQRHFATTGVSENIVDASWQALSEAITYHLVEAGVEGVSDF
ncbi:MAG: citramalate synthase [Phycisphaeraceae bacterium]